MCYLAGTSKLDFVAFRTVFVCMYDSHPIFRTHSVGGLCFPDDFSIFRALKTFGKPRVFNTFSIPCRISTFRRAGGDHMTVPDLQKQQKTAKEDRQVRKSHASNTFAVRAE